MLMIAASPFLKVDSLVLVPFVSLTSVAFDDAPTVRDIVIEGAPRCKVHQDVGSRRRKKRTPRR